jgi:ABC-type nitrate/sulfonate/bicarbonate transport system permease component
LAAVSARRGHRLLQLAPLLAVAALWEALSAVGVIPENRLPPPTRVLGGLAELLSHGLPPGSSLLGHCAASLRRVFGGVGAALVLAIPLGLLMGRSWRLRTLFNPFIELTRPIPPLAWVPLAILWFGIGDLSAVFIIFLGAFFPILLNTVAGVLSIERGLIEAAIILGASRRDLFLKVLAPGATPAIFTGVRIAVGVGWMTLVAAEFTGVKSGYGLGYMIMVARDIQRADQIIAGMLVIGLIGYAMDALIRAGERRLLRWR